MKNSFSALILSSLLKSWGPIISLLGISLVFLGYFFVPSTDIVSLKWFVVTLSACMFSIIVFARAAWEASNAQKFILPKVIYVKDPPKAFSNAFALFLLEPTTLLSHDSVVSIYFLEDDVEKLVGIGKVINIQNDLKVQVLVLQNYDFGTKAEVIKQNSKDELKKLIIKPSIPSLYLEAINNG